MGLLRGKPQKNRKSNVITGNQVRQQFIDFFKEHDHRFVPSAPVLPIGDDSLLFTNAGMNQFKDIFLGLRKPDHPRAANTQKCIRAGGKHNDLEEVGRDTYHHTFFEMLGNWSFGDYFKAEAIEWAWQLLTEVWGLDAEKFYATYFEGDEKHGLEPDLEAKKLWQRFLPDDRILPGNAKDNFWEMGDTGPCGPCSELHYDGRTDAEIAKQPGAELVNMDHPQVIEVWNLVFIQYNRAADGLSPLPARHVDTGMGFERIVRFLQGKTSNYDTDVFSPVIDKIAELTGYTYKGDLEDRHDIAFRVIADHIRALTFAITDGVTLSNEGRGYVMRRILRRASRFGRVLDMHEPFLYKLVDVLVDTMGGAFPEIGNRAEFVTTVIESEEKSFNRTLDRGLEIFATAADRAEKSGEKTIAGQDAFQLYDTFGFPLDLTQLMARERGLSVDQGGFEQLMEQQRARARAAQKTTTMNVAAQALPQTDDSPKYATDSVITKVLGWITPDGFVEEGTLTEAGGEVALVLAETCFYAESGGQIGDCGMIETKGGSFAVEKTEKIADCVIHRGKAVGGEIKPGDEATATVDRQRNASRKNHTATHLLQWALQEVLGDSVHQQGSLVCPDYLRFDFTWPKAMTAEEIRRVEHLVNEKVHEDWPITCSVMPVDDAKQLGAMALFNEKYGDEVRVVAVGAEDETAIGDAFSREFCGGTHVERTGQIEGFKIVKEESISAGVRRITGLTGPGMVEYLSKRSEIIDDLTELLKVPAEQVQARVGKLLEDNKKLQKEIKNAGKRGASDVMAEAQKLLADAEKVDGVAVVAGRLSSGPVQQVREAIDSVKKKASSAAIVLGFAEDDGKVLLFSAMTDDVVKKGLKAGDVIKEIAPMVGGGGGGRPQMAQAGGKNPAGLDDAIAKGAQMIKDTLAG